MNATVQERVCHLCSNEFLLPLPSKSYAQLLHDACNVISCACDLQKASCLGCVTNTKMLFDLWPRKSGGSPVISVPPLPQYICLDGSMRTWPARDRHDFTIRPSKRLYSCATDENVKGCKNILVSGRIIRKREWTVIG